MEAASAQEQRTRLQAAMSLLAALAGGLEDGIGASAQTVTYVAGKNLGRQWAMGAQRTEDVEAALRQLEAILYEHHCQWHFETFRPQADGEAQGAGAGGEAEGAGGADEEVMLVFRDCMIRQSLFRFGHAQRGSLCNMMNGFFGGALERILGREANLEIVHAGENACYKRLRLKRAGGGAGVLQ